MRGAVVVWIGFASLLACAAPARAQDHDAEAGARIHYESGVEYYRDKRPDKAFVEFVEAYRLAPRAELIFDRARCLEELARPREALACYRAYLTGTIGEGRGPAEARVAALAPKADERVIVTCPTELGLVTPAGPVAPRPIYKSWWPWTILGVVVVGGLAVGLGVGLTRAPPASTFPAVQ